MIMQLPQTPASRQEVDRSKVLAARSLQSVYERTDRLFAGLLIFQWLAAIGIAVWISPRAWAGALSHTHPHVWAAVGLGAAIISLPVALAFRSPGWVVTRHVIAMAQMLMGALLIHLVGGRIEMHFHIFGSLAFLSFYRDWKVLLTATIVAASDHFLRGLIWPESIYGISTGA
ncbi:MAG: hypothetical protein WCL32_22360, partial [Planctomycetota bacterium]